VTVQVGGDMSYHAHVGLADTITSSITAGTGASVITGTTAGATVTECFLDELGQLTFTGDKNQ